MINGAVMPESKKGNKIRKPFYRHLYVQVLFGVVLGIDKFMSECRALTNFIGNGVACVMVSRWEGELDRAALKAGLHDMTALPAE